MTTSTSEKYNIICFSNQLWSYPLWTNKRHAMSRLSKAGHNVIFVDPPINLGRLFLRQLVSGLWTLKRLITGVYTDSNVTIYSPIRVLPGDTLEATYGARSYINRLISLKGNLFDPELKTILWVYHVEFTGLFTMLAELSHDILVYDCVDNYSAFPKYDTPEKKQAVVQKEERLAKQADLVFTTAPGLFDRMKKLNSNTFFTPNVGDFEQFNKAYGRKDLVPSDICSINKPVIGYTGALDSYKFDSKLFKYLVERFPNYNFVLIGPVALKDREGSLEELGLSGYDNVFFLGTRPHPTMQNYFAGFDAFIIPYQLNEYTVGGCFPVKFHESLAIGLPTIVTDLPTYKPFSDVCYISKNYPEFGDNLKLALEEDSDQKISARMKVAKDNSWEGKINLMLGHIAQTLQNKL